MLNREKDLQWIVSHLEKKNEKEEEKETVITTTTLSHTF